MKHGPGWIILEDGGAERKLISILPARKSAAYVAEYVEQLYVDRSSSIAERIEYKKSRARAAYPATIDQYSRIVNCGHMPFLSAFPAFEIELNGNSLTFWYRLPEKRAGVESVFMDKRLSLVVAD